MPLLLSSRYLFLSLSFSFLLFLSLPLFLSLSLSLPYPSFQLPYHQHPKQSFFASLPEPLFTFDAYDPLVAAYRKINDEVTSSFLSLPFLPPFFPPFSFSSPNSPPSPPPPLLDWGQHNRQRRNERNSWFSPPLSLYSPSSSFSIFKFCGVSF